MLFLFNSAYRPEYVKNVMNTLNLPSGAVNEYQYSETSSDYNYVDDSANPRKNEKLIGEEVIILYLDRDQIPFMVFPLRKGTLSEVEPREGRIYYYVKLGDYAYSDSIADFNSQLQSCVGDYLYQERKNEDDEIIKSGFFAFQNNETGSNNLISGLKTGDDSWFKTIQLIENCKKFKDENICVFTKFSLKNGKGLITPTSKKKDWYYKLVATKEYTATIDYHFVDSAIFNTTSSYNVNWSFNAEKDNLQISNNRKEVGASQSHFDFPIITGSFGRNSASQSFSLSDNSGNKVIRFAQKPINLQIGINAVRIGLIAFLLLALFACNVVSSLKTDAVIKKYVELENTGPLNFYQDAILRAANLINKYYEIVPAITAAVTTGCTAIVAILLGRKK